MLQTLRFTLARWILGNCKYHLNHQNQIVNYPVDKVQVQYKDKLPEQTSIVYKGNVLLLLESTTTTITFFVTAETVTAFMSTCDAGWGFKLNF